MSPLNESQKNIMFLLGQRSEDIWEAKNGSMGGVYVAAVDMGEEISLEIEGNPDSVITSFCCPRDEAEELKEFLISELKILGAHVYKKYEDFEAKYYEE